MTWIAVLDDGPASGQRHEFGVNPVHEDLWLMPHPSPNIDGYVIVARDELPEPAWDEQVHYVRKSEELTEDGVVFHFALCDLDRLRYRWPGMPWDEPVRVTVPDVASGYACRVCIAMKGIKGNQVKDLSHDPAEVRQHIRQVHA